METETQTPPPKKARNLTDVAGWGIAGLVVLTLLAIACYNWRGEYVGRVLWQGKTARLQTDSLRLAVRAVVAENRVLTDRAKFDKERQGAIANVSSLSSNLADAKAASNQAVSKLTALQKKQAADAGAIRVGSTLPTTVADTSVNEVVAKLSGQVKVYEDSIPKLLQTVGRQKAQIQTLEGEKSELEDNLNNVYRAVGDVRTDVQAKVAERGILRAHSKSQFRSVDKQLSELQKARKK